mmetsp:Transcript_7990/g.24028  ORF Transcript_7990/g.24028 Transcript_7990/m.24028 type:complete len:302 (-) Transcript_7990:28-933(-)
MKKAVLKLLHPPLNNRYTVKETIGHGHYSCVKKAIDNDSGNEVAVKILSLETALQKQEIELEIKIMNSVNHPHCVRILDQHRTSHHVYLILEYLSGGDLVHHVSSLGEYTESHAARFIAQILGAVDHLHGMGIVHRDLKPDNILFCSPAEDSDLKIIDFGLSKVLSPGSDMCRTLCGTPVFQSPEIIAREVRPDADRWYGRACDVWSAGVVLFCLLSGDFPFDVSAGLPELHQQIFFGAYRFRAESWGGVSPEAKALVRSMLTVEPSHRPAASVCLEHAWLKAHQESSHRPALAHAHHRIR